jgi:ribose 5-phosphate isomerase B
VIGPELAKVVVDRFLQSTYDGGNSAPKVDRIAQYEAGRCT